MNQHKQPILDKVKEVVALAKNKHQFDIRFEDLNIRFVTKGQAAASASVRRNWGSPQYGLTFSLESADLDIKEMLEDTIPHEVAHLVNFYNPTTGKNHDAGWRRTCIALGGTGDRTHSQTLSKAKYRKAYLYITTSGHERLIKSAAKHNKIQRGAIYTITRTGETYGASHFVRTISSAEHRKMHQAEVTQYRAANGKAPASPKRATTSHKRPTASHKRPTASHKLPKPASKKARAQAIYDRCPSTGRAGIIAKFISELDMTMAGASTYYYNIVK